MFFDSYWETTPPPLSPELSDWLTDTGSLTMRLEATGHRFSVAVLQQGPNHVEPDEAGLIGLDNGATLYARHVALQLDGIAVVVARSITRIDNTDWIAILERGKRSLGLTLFGKDSGIIRNDMLYQDITAGHPLFVLAAQQVSHSAHLHFPARRSNFVLNGAALNVCEIFLPALENFL